MEMCLRLRRRFWLAGSAAMLTAATSSVAPARADGTKKTMESLTKMVKEAGLKSTIDNDLPGHILLFEGKGGRKFPVVIGVKDDILVMTSIVAGADKITRPPGIEAALLAANFDYGFLKIVFDKKGNLVFRYDCFENMVDADDLKKLVKEMVDNTNNFYDNAPWIKK